VKEGAHAVVSGAGWRRFQREGTQPGPREAKRRKSPERPMEGLAEWLFGGARLQLVESADRAGKSTVTLVVDDVKAYYEELGKRGLNPGALDETTSDKVLFGYIADPEGNQIALVELRPGRP
jgi:hypothetical protein